MIWLIPSRPICSDSVAMLSSEQQEEEEKTSYFLWCGNTSVTKEI